MVYLVIFRPERMLKDECSDYNFIRQGDKCVPVGPEPIPPGVCPAHDPNQMYMGSSGYRRIPGNTCHRDGGKQKDDPVQKPCSNGSCTFAKEVRVLIFSQRNHKKEKLYTRL